MSQTSPDLDQHLYALGRLCVTWATLERHLNELAAEMLNSSRGAALAVFGDMTTRSKCELIKKLAYERKFEDDWKGSCAKLLDKIGNTLGPKRNRFTHDYWSVTNDSLERLDSRASLGKIPHLGKALIYETWNKHLPEDVDVLTHHIGDAIILLQIARKNVSMFNREQPPSKQVQLNHITTWIDALAEHRPANPTRSPRAEPSNR